jgi:Rubredoxin-like zinc ribbon domain (DUF35_N)
VSFPLPVCATCGNAAFPRRLLCPRCGGREWRTEPVDTGVVERASGSVAAVRTPLGPVLLARLVGTGPEVTLDSDGSVPVAS